MVKVFISQPMRNKTNEQIEKDRERIIKILKKDYYDDFEIIDSFFKDKEEVKTRPLYCLAKSIELLSNANVAYFSKGWNEARGCKIEYECATKYGIHTIAE